MNNKIFQSIIPRAKLAIQIISGKQTPKNMVNWNDINWNDIRWILNVKYALDVSSDKKDLKEMLKRVDAVGGHSGGSMGWSIRNAKQVIDHDKKWGQGQGMKKFITNKGYLY